jgi:hypothetical protein
MHLMRFAALGIFEIRNVPVCWLPMSSPAQANRPSVVAIATATMTAVVAIQVSVRELKTHLCEWLSRAQAGEVVGVTSHRLRIGIELMILRPQR